MTANFKETQIADMRIGQKAWFTVDGMKHQKFYGKVEQISPAAGSEFSVLKADNATGNFTKVVQRIAVKIAIDPNQAGLENSKTRHVRSSLRSMSPIKQRNLKMLAQIGSG